MGKGTGKIAAIAVLSALSAVLLYFASILPTGRLALIAIAGLLPAVAVVNYGLSGGVYCFVVSGALALLVLPVKAPAIVYAVFFGNYPIIKSLIERIRKLPLEWLLKLVWMNAVLTLLYFVLTEVFLELAPGGSAYTLIVYTVCNIAFIIYDIGFTGLLHSYGGLIKRLRK